MIVRVIGGLVAAVALTAGALVFGFKGYQAYLRWLVAGQGPGTTHELAHKASMENRAG
jgi:hypothetical protein